MARRVFFSFHYEKDVWRAANVRNSYVTQDVAGFIDAANWETVKNQGVEAIKKWIGEQLDGTSVTIVLIGTETDTREWVRHELLKSWVKGNGIFGVYIHQIKDQNQKTAVKGTNHFGPIFKYKTDDGKKFFCERFKTYDWIDDVGRDNFTNWIEAAAKQAGK